MSWGVCVCVWGNNNDQRHNLCLFSFELQQSSWHEIQVTSFALLTHKSQHFGHVSQLMRVWKGKITAAHDMMSSWWFNHFETYVHHQEHMKAASCESIHISKRSDHVVYPYTRYNVVPTINHPQMVGLSLAFHSSKNAGRSLPWNAPPGWPGIPGWPGWPRCYIHHKGLRPHG